MNLLVYHLNLSIECSLLDVNCAALPGSKVSRYHVSVPILYCLITGLRRDHMTWFLKELNIILPGVIWRPWVHMTTLLHSIPALLLQSA